MAVMIEFYGVAPHICVLLLRVTFRVPGILRRLLDLKKKNCATLIYEGWNFNSGNYLFTTDTR